MDKNISFTLKVWRQAGPKAKGAFETYQMKDIPGDTSFLEMLDILNEQLISERKEPVVFDHDCREGICGMCSLYINGHPHGPATGATTCQIYMRRFNDGDTITVEPWRSAGFPVIKDLMVDRTAYDKIMQWRLCPQLQPLRVLSGFPEAGRPDSCCSARQPYLSGNTSVCRTPQAGSGKSLSLECCASLQYHCTS